MTQIPVHELALPEYTVASRPDYRAIGRKIDDKLCELYLGRAIVLRGITIDDHPGKSLDDLVEIVCDLGHDLYSPDREGVHYPTDFKIDMHAVLFGEVDGIVRQETEYSWDMVASFYEGPPSDRNGPPIRLDLMMVFDPDQLEYVQVPWTEDYSCMYRFRFPQRKREALLGVIRLLR